MPAENADLDFKPLQMRAYILGRHEGTEMAKKFSLTAGQKEMTRAALRRIMLEEIVARLNRLEIQIATVANWQRRQNEPKKGMECQHQQ